MRVAPALLGSMLFALLGTLSGCDGGVTGGSSDASVDLGGSQGTWIEVRDDVAASARMAPQESLTRNLRQLTLNADNTFKLEFVTPGGDPSGEGSASGTWKTEGGSILFEIAENTLDEKLKPATPSRTPGAQNLVTPGTGEKMVRLMLFDETGGMALLKKK